MKVKITLDGGAGELDSKTFEVGSSDADLQEAISTAALIAIDQWTLSVGDTITIREVG